MTALAALTQTVPEQGQLVEVRRQRYVVLDVRRSTLPVELGVSPQHLVDLASVEDDGLGEELSVLWEIEPGARVFERAALPSLGALDPPARLDAFLDAVAWGSVASANASTLQAPFRAGIDIEDYQLEPVVRAIEMPRVSLLVADDVGLGKTIEAGIVVQELLLRHRARTALVVCPPALQLQWRDQMRDKFGLEFRIIDSESMRELRRRRGLHVNPWTHFPRLITSIDFLKQERVLRLFREVLPAAGQDVYPRRFDLLIVDEAHNVAPSGRGRYALDSLRTTTIRTLAPHFEHKLFLSATPHNGYSESFTALLELLDDQRFARTVRPDVAQLGAVMVRRLKRDIVRADGTPRYAPRRVATIEVAYGEAEKTAHARLREYAALRKAAPLGDEGARFAVDFVLKLLKKRLFSSPAAFARTLAQHERGLASSAATADLHEQAESLDDTWYDDDAVYDDETETVVEAASRSVPRDDAAATLLRAMRRDAEDATGRPDAKAHALLAWLRATLRPDGAWNDERVIIFTEYRDTQKWLQGILAQAGFAEDTPRGRRLLLLFGGMASDERERVKAAFQASPDVSGVRILLATDAASEGLDLQNHCARLIHYEIPWNPMRMEQRNGRVDRHGQRRSEVEILHFVGQSYRERDTPIEVRGEELEDDLEFLFRTAKKVEAIREDLGKVGPVLAQQVEEAMLRRRVRIDTDAAERDAAPLRRLLKMERALKDRVAELRAQLDASMRELHVSPANLEAVVSIGLELSGHGPLLPIELSGGLRAFHLPPLRGTWIRAAEGLAHPHTRELRPITFEREGVSGRDDVVLAHLEHPLVQLCTRLLRAEVWSRDETRKLHRITARRAIPGGVEGPVAIAHGRLVVLGADHQRLHEEILAAAIRLDGPRGVRSRLNVGETEKALAAQSTEAVASSVSDPWRAQWDRLAEDLLRALEDRAKDRTKSLGRAFEDRAEREATAVRALLTELAARIRETLDDRDDTPMLPGFAREEVLQKDRDRAALRERLERIPGEITREAGAIRARYAEVSPRLFPLAVTILVP